MNAAEREVHSEGGSELGKARNHAGGAHESDPLMESEAPRPAWQLDERLELSGLHGAEFTVSAVVDPELSSPQSRGVRARQASGDHVPAGAGEHDTAPGDWEIAIRRAPAGHAIGGGRKGAPLEIGTGND